MIAEFDGNGQATNLQAMSASELYLAIYALKPAGPRCLGGQSPWGFAPFAIWRAAKIRWLHRV